MSNRKEKVKKQKEPLLPGQKKMMISIGIFIVVLIVVG